MNTQTTPILKRHYRGFRYAVAHGPNGYIGIVYPDDPDAPLATSRPFPTVREADGAAVRMIQDLIHSTFD